VGYLQNGGGAFLLYAFEGGYVAVRMIFGQAEDLIITVLLA
jgi:hypothetical protein